MNKLRKITPVERSFEHYYNLAHPFDPHNLDQELNEIFWRKPTVTWPDYLMYAFIIFYSALFLALLVPAIIGYFR